MPLWPNSNLGKQWYDPRDWGKSEKDIVAKNKIDNPQSVIIADDDTMESRINAQQELKGEYSLSDANSGMGGYKNGDTLFYPQELFTESQPHGVHFYINARQTSAAAEDEASNPANVDKLRQVNETYNKEYTAENRSKAESYENAAMMSGTLAAALGTGALIKGKKIIEGSSGLGKLVTTVGAGIVGGVLGKLLTRNTSTMRLLKSIQLHIPQSVMSSYTASWDETSLGIAGMLGSGKFDMSDLTELPEFLGRGTIAAAAAIPKGLGANADFAATLEATSKKVANPYKEQLFKSMGFRKFSFSYNFAPRNIGEANMVMEIIDTFKYHMHPEASSGDMFLIYPSEFSIEFEILDENTGTVGRNKYLPRVSSCALTNVKATYGPDGFFNTFQDTQGMPTEMALELQFTELETLTAVRIAQGH